MSEEDRVEVLFVEFVMEKHATIPWWKKILVRMFGKPWRYDNETFAYEWRGKLYYF